MVVGRGVVLTKVHWASGPFMAFQSQSHQLSFTEQVQIMPSSVTDSPSVMILSDGVLQLYPGGDGDGDGININNNNSSNNNEEENVSMDRILSVSSEGVVMGIKVTYCMGGSCNCQEILGTVQRMYCPSDCACVRARARACVCVCVCVFVLW